MCRLSSSSLCVRTCAYVCVCPDHLTRTTPAIARSRRTLEVKYLQAVSLAPRVCVCVFVCADIRRYKFAELEAKLATARLLQQYTFLPVEGQEPKMQSGLTYAPDQILLRVQRRQEAEKLAVVILPEACPGPGKRVPSA